MVGAPGGLRKRAPLLVAIPLLGLLAALAVLQTATAAKRQAIGQPDLLLRLHDLPPGYLNVELQEEQGERTFCSPLHDPDDTPKALARFVDRFRPKGCVGAYYRLFTVPAQPSGPVLAGTGVLEMSNDRAADAAWSVVPQLLGRLLNDHPPRKVTAPEEVGSDTELFHAAQPRIYSFPYKIAPTASLLVWRSGATLAVVMAVGRSFAEDDQAAVELARRQQAHIRRPTRYTRAERFDGEVALDDPALEMPVYWLGRNFRPGYGLPNNRLYGSYASDGSEEEIPGALLGIGYEQIRLNTWTQQTWPEYRDTSAAHAIASWHCTKTTTIEVPGGYATIYGGYKENYRRCPTQAPRAFTARVYIGDLVIAVNPIPLSPPSPPGFAPSLFIETVNPYGSFKGMEAIVRSLRLRPKPVYPTG
jgi:hypothetical protein